MADGYRYPQSTNYFYPSAAQHQRHITRNDSQGVRTAFPIDTPSPSHSPDPQSPAQNLYSMFGRNHQSGQYGRVNGGPAQQTMHFTNNPYAHQQQPQSQHHQNLQQDHNTHNANGNLGHHATYQSGVLSSSTPTFTPSQLPNGHSGATRGGQAVQISEHWGEQLALHKECQKVHQIMTTDQAPNHYARSRGHEQRMLPTSSQEDNVEDLGRPSNWQRPARRQDWKDLDMSGQGLKILTPPVFAYQFLVELYISSNHLRALPAAIGGLKNLGLLDVSNNELTSVPQELGRCVFLRRLLLFDNKINSLPNTLGYLYQLEMLGIEGNPLPSDIKNIVMEKGTKALIHHLRETISEEQEALNLEPNRRDMIDLHEGNASPASQERLKVLSYNTLCHKYATVSQYGYLPSGALDWEWRKTKVLMELREREADILCLQEIDAHNYNEFFRAELSYDGYKGIFWPKSRARTMSEKDAKIVDGCAIFYKHEKYILLDKALIDIANIAINRPDMKNQPDIFNRVMPKDHVGVIAFLENRATGSRLIVVNTHLEWNATFADVKIIQTAILLDTVAKAAEKYARWPACKDKKNYGLQDDTSLNGSAPEPVQEPAPSMEYTSASQIPLIVCGDFNSLADSGVYELLDKGSIEKDHQDLGDFKYGNFTRDGIQHPFSLRSSYSHLNGTANHIPFTNYTPGFVGVIDYIWYSNNTLECTKLLGPVDPEYLQRVPAFPSWHFPSDHLSLASEFVIKGSSASKKKMVTEPDFGPQRDRRN